MNYPWSWLMNGQGAPAMSDSVFAKLSGVVLSATMTRGCLPQGNNPSIRAIDKLAGFLAKGRLEPKLREQAVTLGAAPMFDVKPHERRRHDRFELALPGRCMLFDRVEYPCWTIDVSPSGLGIVGLHKGDIGDRIVAYISQIGRVEGLIARHFAKGFGFEIQAPALKREKLAQRIAWLVRREAFDLPDNRRHDRIFAEAQQIKLTTSDGHEFAATLIDVSGPSAAFNVNAAPPIGSAVTVGRTAARVIRHFPGGVAVSFDDNLPAEAVGEQGEV